MGIKISASFREEFGKLSTRQALVLSDKKWEKIEDILRRLEVEVLGANTCAACSKFKSLTCNTDKGDSCPLGTSADCCGGTWDKASNAIYRAGLAATRVRNHIKMKLRKLPT